jgi:hypothetical protein
MSVLQRWEVDGDERAWLEAFLPMAYAIKMLSNFRGDAALGVWAVLSVAWTPLVLSLQAAMFDWFV